jgi:hypothetical protein
MSFFFAPTTCSHFRAMNWQSEFLSWQPVGHHLLALSFTYSPNFIW